MNLLQSRVIHILGKFAPSLKLSGEALQCTEVRFASFLSDGFTTMAVINPPEGKLAKHTYVQCTELEAEINLAALSMV